MSVKDHIKSIARDLTSLEVNTIRRASITGESMPDPRHALYDVASEYNDVLNELLNGDHRVVDGPDCLLSCRFTRSAYDPGDAGLVEVVLKALSGTPLANEPVIASVYPAPILTTRDDNGKARPMMQPVPPRPPAQVMTDAQGIARMPFGLEMTDRPCVALVVEARGLKAEMYVPLRKVRGDLHAFQYLNHRANKATTIERAWLKRRIELNSIRMAALLESLEPVKGGVGCDNNDYSRRQLNGDPETTEGAQQTKPPPLKLSPVNLVTLRKTWELGCEEILMQTVVQLDGDVVTRLSQDAATEEATLIHRIHTEGVRVATQSWQHLVESLSSFAKSFFG